MENLIENTLTEAVTEVGKGAVGGGLEKAEAAEEAEPGVIAQGRSQLAVGIDLTEVD
jgi:hypothetical protein